MTLPYPPSVNHYWRRVGPRTLISREGRTFRAHCVGAVKEQLARGDDGSANDAALSASGATGVCALLGGGGPRKPPCGGRIALCMDAFPPDRRRRDLDNIAKPVLDALEHAGVYEDDSQIDLLVTRRREVVKGGRLNVDIEEFPLCRCPLCGAPFNPENN